MRGLPWRTIPPGGTSRRSEDGPDPQEGDEAGRTDPQEGDEPDYRFTLANERTFLAWIRTSFALLAGGVAVRQAVEPFDVRGGRQVLAVMAIVLSGVTAALGLRHWAAVQRAMRLGRPLPEPAGVRVLVVGLVGIAAAAVVLVLA